MERRNEDSNSPTELSVGSLGHRDDRISEPKSPARASVDPKHLKARPLRREQAPQATPADPLEGFVVRERELVWIEDVLAGLTPRQRDVLLECCSGGTSVEIAARMRISQSTFQNHLHAMRLHLGVSGKDSIARLVGVRLLNGYRTRLAGGSS